MKVDNFAEGVYSNVWDPCLIVSKPGFRYFVTFVNDYSRMTWIYFMKNRLKVFSHFRAFLCQERTQFGVTV